MLYKVTRKDQALLFTQRDGDNRSYCDEKMSKVLFKPSFVWSWKGVTDYVTREKHVLSLAVPKEFL